MREDITPEYDVSRIIMDAEANPSKIYVVLEGRGDQIVWENCFNNLVQYRVPDNIISNQKQSVINICQISFSREVFNIIGIVDSDFDRLYTPYNHIVLKNLFYSDHHDIDIMLFMSNALEKYLRVRGSIKLDCKYFEI